MRARILALAALAIVAGSFSFAQNRKPKLQWERFEGEGTVAAFQNGALLMSLNGERWIGALVPASKVSITGYANRNILRPGVVVRLSAEFDRKTLAALEPVSDLAIVSPQPGERAGVFPDEVIDPTERKKGPPPATAKLRIFDAITGVKENTLFFKKYRVDVSPDATIKVDLADPSLLTQGDAIKNVKGRRIKGTQGRLVIEELEAELAQPLEARNKRAVKNADKRKSDKKGDVFGIAGEEASGKKESKNTKLRKGEKQNNEETEKAAPLEDQLDDKGPTLQK